MLKASQMRGRVKGLPGAAVSISVKFGGIEEAGIHHLTQACFCFFFSSCHRLDIKKKRHKGRTFLICRAQPSEEMALLQEK